MQEAATTIKTMCTLTLRNVHLPYTYSYITGLRRVLTGIRQKFGVACYCSHGTEQQADVATKHDDLIHIPVMVKQVLEALQPANGQVTILYSLHQMCVSVSLNFKNSFGNDLK